MKLFIKAILESCDLSTDKVDEIRISKPKQRRYSEDDIRAQAAAASDEYEVYYRNMKKAQQEKTLQ